MYLMHRFAINSLAKTIGGMEYANSIRGDGIGCNAPDLRTYSAQGADALIAAMSPAELAIPDTVCHCSGHVRSVQSLRRAVQQPHASGV